MITEFFDDFLCVGVVDDLAFVDGADDFVVGAPFGVAAEEGFVSREVRAVGVYGEQFVDARAFQIPVAAEVEEDSFTFAGPEGVIDEEADVVDFGSGGPHVVGECGEGYEHLFFAGLDIDFVDAVGFGAGGFACPVVGAAVAGDSSEGVHASVVEAEEVATILGYAAVADGRFFETVFLDAFLFFDVVENAEYFLRFCIAVVEEELSFLCVGIPVKHSSLLWIPGPGFFNLRGFVVVFRIEEDDVGGVVGSGHAFLECRAQHDHVAAALVPRGIAHVSDVAEKMVGGAMGYV